MNKLISTIIAVGFISTIMVNSAYAGHRHIAVFNPLWVPAAILSTVAATVATIVPPPVIIERQVYSEPQQTVIYEEPRHYRNERYYVRGPAYYYYDEQGRAYAAPQYRYFRRF